MKSRIWRLAGVGLLCVSVSAQTLADDPQSRGPQGGQRGPEQPGNNQGRGGEQQNQPRPQNNQIIRGDNSRQFEHNGQNQNQNHDQNRWQGRESLGEDRSVIPGAVSAAPGMTPSIT